MPGRERFAYIDGLRGLAALWVAALHLLATPVEGVSPFLGRQVLGRGFLGVIIFFVISGFAIAHSLGDTTITLRAFGRFLLRRMARLDPPYWASMIVGWAVVAISASVLKRPVEWPSVGETLANVFYLQYIVDVPTFCVVYWSLTFEIQFYLLLVGVLALKQRLGRFLDEPSAAMAASFPLLVISILAAIHVLPPSRSACFEYWFAFAAGVAAQRAIAGKGYGQLVGMVLVALAISAWNRNPLGLVVAATAASLGLAHHLGRLGAWLAGRPFQYRGRISYSLYLVHAPIGGRLQNLLKRFLGESQPMQIVGGLIGFATALAVADLFWRLVERPSIALSRRVATVRA